MLNKNIIKLVNNIKEYNKLFGKNESEKALKIWCRIEDTRNDFAAMGTLTQIYWENGIAQTMIVTLNEDIIEGVNTTIEFKFN